MNKQKDYKNFLNFIIDEENHNLLIYYILRRLNKKNAKTITQLVENFNLSNFFINYIKGKNNKIYIYTILETISLNPSYHYDYHYEDEIIELLKLGSSPFQYTYKSFYENGMIISPETNKKNLFDKFQYIINNNDYPYTLKQNIIKNINTIIKNIEKEKDPFYCGNL